jgi:cytochrome c556
MHKAVNIGVGVALATAFATAAVAQTPAERAIKYRQGAFQVMAWNMGPMAAMVKGERPYDKDEFLRRATIVEHAAPLPWEAFGAGTDAGAPTKAKAEIWKDQAKFKQYADALQAESVKLVAAAKVGTLDAVKGPFGAVGKACSNCHDDFRAK